MIIWLNGTFGAGKTTTGMRLAGRLANARLFDPEEVAYLLMRTLEDHEFRDFQEASRRGGNWSRSSPERSFTGQHLIAVQTVQRGEYWQELTAASSELSWTSSTCCCTSTPTFWPNGSTPTKPWQSPASGATTTSATTRRRGRGWNRPPTSGLAPARLPAAEVAERIAVEAEQRLAASPSLCGGIRLHGVAEWACYEEPVAAQRYVEGALYPRPVLERARRRIRHLVGEVDGFDLRPRHVDVKLPRPAPRNGLAS